MSENTPYTVLGAGGFVGSQMAAYLRARGVSCETPARDDLSWLLRPLGHVIYCIGLTADYASRPYDTVEAHVSLFSRLMRDGDFESVVYLSSTRVYDGLAFDGTESTDLLLNPHNPRHLYDLSKALGESLVCAGGRANARVARLSCVYGGDLSADNFLHRLVRAASQQTPVELETWPHSARDYVHIDDVCAALLAIGKRGRQPIYNVASGENVTNRALFDAVTRLTGCIVRTTPPAGHEPATTPRADVTHLNRDLGIRPRSVLDMLPSLFESAHAPRAAWKVAS